MNKGLQIMSMAVFTCMVVQTQTQMVSGKINHLCDGSEFEFYRIPFSILCT